MAAMNANKKYFFLDCRPAHNEITDFHRPVRLPGPRIGKSPAGVGLRACRAFFAAQLERFARIKAAFYGCLGDIEALERPFLRRIFLFASGIYYIMGIREGIPK